MDELIILRETFNKELMLAIGKAFQDSPLKNLSDIILYICFTVGFFQSFQKIGTNSFGSYFLKFIIRTWLALALMYGGKYLNQGPFSLNTLNNGSSKPLYISLYDQVESVTKNATEKMAEGGKADASMLAYNTSQLMDFQDNLIQALWECEETNSPCLRSYLYTGQSPENKPSDSLNIDPTEKSKMEDSADASASLVSLAVQYTGMGAFVSIIEKILQFFIRFFANPGLILFPILQWSLGLASALMNFGLLIFWGIAVSASLLLTQVLTPFMILPQFTSNVKSMYKALFSTALYSFVMHLIIWISNFLMSGLLDTTRSLMIPRILSAAENASKMPANGAIASLMISNFIAALAIVAIQLVAMKNVPKFASSIFGLSLTSIVQIGETVFDAGMSFAKMAAKVGVVVAGTVATAGAGAVVAAGTTAAGAGATAAAGASKMAGAGAKIAAQTSSKMASSAIAKTSSKVGSSVSKMGGSNSVFNKLGNKISSSGNDLANKTSQAGNKVGKMMDKAGKNTSKKITETKSIFKKHFSNDEDLSQNKTENSSGSNMVEKKLGSSSNEKNKSDNKDGMISNFVKRNAKKIKPMKIVETLVDSAFDSTKMGAKSVFGEGQDTASALFQKVADIDADIFGLNEKTKPSSVKSPQKENPINSNDSLTKKLDASAFLNNQNKELMDDDKNNEFNELSSKISMGIATPEEMGQFRSIANTYDLDENQKEEFNKISETNQSFKDYDEVNQNENDELIENIKDSDSLSNSSAMTLKEKIENGEINKDVLSDEQIALKLESYKANNLKESERMIKEMEKIILDNKGKIEKDQVKIEKNQKMELVKLYKNQSFKDSANKETIEKLTSIIKELKKD